MLVTGIRRKGNNVLIEFNNSDKISVPYDIFLKNYLHVSDELSCEDKLQLENESEKYRIKQSCFRYLSGRNHSKKELRIKLLKKQYNKSFIDEAIDTLEQQGFINDEIFAKEYFELQQKKRKGSAKIKSELFKKGVNREIIEKTLTDQFDEEKFAANASYLAQKKLASMKNQNLEYHKMKQKLYSFLAARGYSSEIIFKVFENIDLKDYDE